MQRVGERDEETSPNDKRQIRRGREGEMRRGRRNEGGEKGSSGRSKESRPPLFLSLPFLSLLHLDRKATGSRKFREFIHGSHG